MDQLAQRIQLRVSDLPQGLQAHISRVCDIAGELASYHGVNPQQARLGALAHDVARAMSDQELLHHAARVGLKVGVVESRVPLMLHGPVGAELLRREDGLADHSLHQAVYWHTTAHPALDALGKVVFLADKLDPHKMGRYPYQPHLRGLAFADLDLAVLEFLTRESISLLSQGKMVHPAMVEARNHLIATGRTATASG